MRLVVAAAITSCGTTKSPADLSGPECDAQKQHLIELVRSLAPQAQTSPLSVVLPSAGLGGAVGQGELLELSPQGAVFRGQPIPGKTLTEVASALAAALSAASLPPGGTLYVAAAHDLDLRTLRRYLLGVPPEQQVKLVYTAASADSAPPADSVTYEYAARVYTETNPQRRVQLSEEAFEAYSSCTAVNGAVHRLHTEPLATRWPQLKLALESELPQCACGELNAPALEFLSIAELRATSGGLGSLAMPFLRDARCAASMPLASVQQVLRDVEAFEEEFSGEWTADALRFEKVVTEERLMNYLCVALPGETLSFLQSEYATLYWKLPGSGQCQAWQFEPISRGAPMGTWRRSDPSGTLPPLAVHYRQGAEELRIFGPATETSRPTEGGPWYCDSDVKMTAADADSIQLETGAWFLTKAACEAAPHTAQLSGCLAELATSAGPYEAAAAAAEGSKLPEPMPQP